MRIVTCNPSFSLPQQLMAVYEEKEAQQRGVAGTSPAPSPDLYQSELSVFQPIRGGEIEVNSTALKSSEYSSGLQTYPVLHFVSPCIPNMVRRQQELIMSHSSSCLALRVELVKEFNS